MNAPRASVIVLAWNGRDYLETCLQAVLAQAYASFEVIVVDNGSTDGSADLVSQAFPQVKLIRSERNLGFASGNNVGLLVANGDLLVLLNQDTQVQPGWLTALATTFEEPGVGIVGCKLRYPDGKIQHAGGYLHGPRAESGHIGRHAVDDGQFDEVADAEFVTAASLAISRFALQQIGLLDEGFKPAYYEDVDWCHRARTSGLRVVYQPLAVVIHKESAATEALSYERKYAWNQGRLRFLFKHWPLHQLLDEFGPAELAWVTSMDRCPELMAARGAYLNNLLTLPGILAFRESPITEADALVGLLADLRTATVAGLAQTPLAEGLGVDSPHQPALDGPVARADVERLRLLEMLYGNQTLHEHIFTSGVPILGRVIASLRNAWNSVATKWYVRPLLHQQTLFNAQLVSYLRNLEHRYQGQSQDVAENIRELGALAERLAYLDSSELGDERMDRASNEAKHS